mmetsp:Transcript_10615/g.19146  ORF Transcript_10615/g.19146 Transcript_10615/m.19146 type:complete len:191 (-) Transcript_10615:91-663(-)
MNEMMSGEVVSDGGSKSMRDSYLEHRETGFGEECLVALYVNTFSTQLSRRKKYHKRWIHIQDGSLSIAKDASSDPEVVYHIEGAYVRKCTNGKALLVTFAGGKRAPKMSIRFRSEDSLNRWSDILMRAASEAEYDLLFSSLESMTSNFKDFQSTPTNVSKDQEFDESEFALRRWHFLVSSISTSSDLDSF